MTYQGSPRNALEAVLAASRQAPSADDIRVRDAGRAAPRLPAQVAVDRAAVSLLAQLLTYRPQQGPPIIQIAACAAGECPARVVASLTRACAVLVGRTLMVQIDHHRTGLFAPPAATGPLPDAFLSGLYYYRIEGTPADAELLYGDMREQALAALARPFRILVIESPSPCDGTTLALAPLCCCTVLVVHAGITRLGAIHAAAASIGAAGGRVVGTVLAGAKRENIMLNLAR